MNAPTTPAKPKRHAIDPAIRLLIVRINLDLSQSLLASRAGLARNTVSHMESGRSVEMGTLLALSDALQVPPHTWLLPDVEWVAWLEEWLGSDSEEGTP